MKRVVAMALCCLASCARQPPPGEPMGSWAVQLVPIDRQCGVAEVTADAFSFDMVLTRDPDSDAAWVTLNNYPRAATFDGQYFSSEGEAARVFSQCSKCSVRMVETMNFAVLSRSQFNALMSVCPLEPLDGGVPAPNEDAGITTPSRTEQGFDGVRLCGELVMTLRSVNADDETTECASDCQGCTVRYQLQGGRR